MKPVEMIVHCPPDVPFRYGNTECCCQMFQIIIRNRRRTQCVIEKPITLFSIEVTE